MRSIDRRRSENARTAYERYEFPEGTRPLSAGDWRWAVSSWDRRIEIPDVSREDRRPIAGLFTVDFLIGTAVVEGATATVEGKRIGRAVDMRVDEWDAAPDGESWYLPMPAETLAQAISGELPSIGITLKDGTYWLHNGSRPGEDDYLSLEEAKAAGDRLAAIAHDGLSDRMARDAGIDPNLWEFVDDTTGIGFVSVEDDTLSIERRGNDEWVAVRDELVIGQGRTAFEALQSIAVAPAP